MLVTILITITIRIRKVNQTKQSQIQPHIQTCLPVYVLLI